MCLSLMELINEKVFVKVVCSHILQFQHLKQRTKLQIFDKKKAHLMMSRNTHVEIVGCLITVSIKILLKTAQQAYFNDEA